MAGKQKPEVQEALKLIAGGMNPYAAAKATGANQQSVYSAARRAVAQSARCPTCGGVLKPGAVVAAPVVTMSMAQAGNLLREKLKAGDPEAELIVLDLMRYCEPEEPEAEEAEDPNQFARVIGPSRLPDIE